MDITDNSLSLLFEILAASRKGKLDSSFRNFSVLFRLISKRLVEQQF